MLHRLSGSPAPSVESPLGAAPWGEAALSWLAEQTGNPEALIPTSPLSHAQGEALLSVLK